MMERPTDYEIDRLEKAGDAAKLAALLREAYSEIDELESLIDHEREIAKEKP